MQGIVASECCIGLWSLSSVGLATSSNERESFLVATCNISSEAARNFKERTVRRLERRS